MRLIDADKLKEEFREDSPIGDVMRIFIDLQPTAYDVDKVLEDLRTTREDYDNEVDYDVSFGIRLAIEIVKDGGDIEN